MLSLKKAASFLLATTMIVSLAACGGTATPVESSASSESTAAPASESTASASESTAPVERKQVELIWYVGGSGPQADYPAVEAEVNKYLKDKLNCTLKIIETDFGSYEQKMQMVIAGQEKFDMCFTSHWSNNYYNNVNKNAFLELDSLVDQYAAELKSDVPQNGWEAVKVKGKIYAVPNQQIWAMTNGISYETEYTDKYAFDINAAKELKDLEPLLSSIKKDNPNMYPFSHSQLGVLDFLTFKMGYDELAGRHIPGVIMLDDAELKVINQFELPQVKEHYKLMYDWNKKGYFRQDAATLTDLTADKKAGKLPIELVGTMKPGNDVISSTIHGGKTIKSVAITDSWQPTSGITATMTAISRTSENPDRAMEFLNLFNTDKTLYNLIVNGIEGKHYTKIDEEFIKPIDNSGYYPNADWMYGNQFLAFLKEGQNKTDWADTKTINQSAKPSPALGFAFDSTAVQTEIASVSAIVKEYQLSLDTGSVDPEVALPEFLKKLEGAGSNTIIAEIQKQLDSWKSSK